MESRWLTAAGDEELGGFTAEKIRQGWKEGRAKARADEGKDRIVAVSRTRKPKQETPADKVCRG